MNKKCINEGHTSRIPANELYEYRNLLKGLDDQHIQSFKQAKGEISQLLGLDLANVQAGYGNFPDYIHAEAKEFLQLVLFNPSLFDNNSTYKNYLLRHELLHRGLQIFDYYESSDRNIFSDLKTNPVSIIEHVSHGTK